MYVARSGIELRTSDLRVRCPTDCATRSGPIYERYTEIVGNACTCYAVTLKHSKPEYIH